MARLSKIISLVLISFNCFGAVSRIQGPRIAPNSEVTVTPPLDAVTNAAFAAYSTARKLRAAYGGNCIKVRRSSDDTEQDIGFITNGAGNVVLDTPALATFCASTDGFVHILYDQTANSLNLTNVNSGQPKIVSSGIILTGSGGRVIADLDGSDDGLFIVKVQILPVTYWLVASPTTFVNNDNYLTGGSTTRTRIGQSTGANRFHINSGATLNDTTTVTAGTYYLVKAYFETGTSDAIQVNANTEVVGTAGDNAVTTLILGSGTVCPDYNFHEWLCFSTAFTSGDATTLRNNENSFYALF